MERDSAAPSGTGTRRVRESGRVRFLRPEHAEVRSHDAHGTDPPSHATGIGRNDTDCDAPSWLSLHMTRNAVRDSRKGKVMVKCFRIVQRTLTELVLVNS